MSSRVVRFKDQDKRFRLHARAPKPEEYVEQVPVFNVEKIPQFFIQEKEFSASNIFKNVVISPDVLKQKLPSFSKKDEDNLNVKEHIRSFSKDIKTGKRKKIPFHEVVASVKDFLEKQKKKEEKKKKEVLGNFQALEEALPALEKLVEEKKKEDNRPRASKPFAKQDAEMKEDLQTYQMVLNDTEYNADPLKATATLLRQRLQSGSL